MPDVAIDYAVCLGEGDCVGACPIGALELTPNGRWCRVAPLHNSSREAEACFIESVEGASEPVPLRIHYRVPGCVCCLVCVAVCSKNAIDISPEYSVVHPVEHITPSVRSRP